MLFYSLDWSKDKEKCYSNINRVKINIKCITSDLKTVTVTKKYDEWVGICTKDIQNTIKLIKWYFPGINLKYTQIESLQFKKILPYFRERLLKKNKLLYKSKNFYKVYSSNAYISDIGIVMDKYKISYYKPEDWLIRLYIDICINNNASSFFYRWYDITDEEMLLDSMRINVSCTEKPAIKIASFDLETISMDSINRIPTGHSMSDKIVMISVIQWNYKYDDQIEKTLLYLNPINTTLVKKIPFNAIEFFNEKDLLKSFHEIVKECHILTGYNINNFDIPCLFSRLMFLQMKRELKLYSSKRIGTYIVPTFQEKIVLDMYKFIQIFSNHNLPSFKLDVVAKCKLNKSKFPIKATAIQHFYIQPMTTETLLCTDKSYVYNLIQPQNMELSEFGTFLNCLEYCLEDSMLVYKLFKTEFTLTFLIERANVAAINVEQALYFGNTKYIVEVYKTFGTCLGYFFNIEFFNNSVERDLEKYKESLVYKNKSYTYQGALNFGIPNTFYKNVVALDFLSMYPSILVNQNLSYETSGLLFKDEYLNLSQDIKNLCDFVPYRTHSENDILIENKFNHESYSHPKIDLDKDNLIMVSVKEQLGFLPNIVNVFLEKRKELQKMYQQTKENTLYTRQLNIKLFLNSIYGSMACSDSQLSYLPTPMCITSFGRIFLLAVSEFIMQVLGYKTVYCDTDGVFILEYPFPNCELINRYLNQKYMILQLEKVMSCLLIISKKRYIYEEKNQYKMAGFEKKANALTKSMTQIIVSESLNALKLKYNDIGYGWMVWKNVLINGYIMSINPKTYCITRKTKQLHEYKSKSCPHLKIIEKNPSKAGEFIEFTYGQTDIALSESNKCILSTDECKEVNFSKLFINQEKIFIDLLNMAFFQYDSRINSIANLRKMCHKVLNTMRWKNFVNAEITSLREHKKPIMILVLKNVKYTFELNDYTIV